MNAVYQCQIWKRNTADEFWMVMTNMPPLSMKAPSSTLCCEYEASSIDEADRKFAEFCTNERRTNLS